LFKLGAYDKFRELCNLFVHYIQEILPEAIVDFATKKIQIKNITMTNEI
jgi:hypothetical protein